jgi:predicted nucleic acid-binding protein
VDFYATKSVDFIDAYHAFHLQQQGHRRIITCDRRHFGRVDWLEAVEP